MKEPTPEQRVAMLQAFLALSIQGNTTPDELLRACFLVVRDSVIDEIADTMANSNHEAEDFAVYVRAMKSGG